MTTTKFVAAMSNRIAKIVVDAYRLRNQGANAIAKNPARNAFGTKNHFGSNGSHQTINGRKDRYANRKKTAVLRAFISAITHNSPKPTRARSTAILPR